jgi:hypothetical protein
MVATYDDAALVVQLVRWGTELGLSDAAHILLSDDFNPATASTDDIAVRKMLEFGEVVGTLVKQNILNKDLVLDLWWVNGAWERVKPAAERDRERLGEARLHENFEALAKSASPSA